MCSWKVLLGIAVLSLGVAPFTNCSQVQFSPTAQKSVKDGTTSLGEVDNNDVDDSEPLPEVPRLPDPTPEIPTPDIAITNCDTAEANGTLQNAAQIVTFEDTKVESGRKRVCEFDKGDNLSTKNNELRARYEQNVKLNLPAGAVICDIQMETDKQDFKYDDTFFLMFNNQILASNLKSTMMNRLSPSAYIDVAGVDDLPLYTYDWMKLRKGAFENVADDYCLGEREGLGRCSWPVSEKTGDIKFSFHHELLTHLGLKASAQQQQFSFVITGDNDEDIDCYHEKLEFLMQIKYYVKN